MTSVYEEGDLPKKGDKLRVITGQYADRIGKVTSLHLKDVGLEFENGDRGSFSYYNVTRELEKEQDEKESKENKKEC